MAKTYANLISEVQSKLKGLSSAYSPDNPIYSDELVGIEINNVIQSLHPRVFAYGVKEFKATGSKANYELPDDALGIVAIQYLQLGGSQRWVPVYNWRFDMIGNQSPVYLTNESGDIMVDPDTLEPIVDYYKYSKVVYVNDYVPGRTVQVVYAKTPSELTTGTQAFASTGLPEYANDVVILGACWRLMSFADANKVDTTYASQAMLNTNQQSAAGSGTNLAKYFAGLYGQRLAETEARMKIEFPALKHFSN